MVLRPFSEALAMSFIVVFSSPLCTNNWRATSISFSRVLYPIYKKILSSWMFLKAKTANLIDKAVFTFNKFIPIRRASLQSGLKAALQEGEAPVFR